MTILFRLAKYLNKYSYLELFNYVARELNRKVLTVLYTNRFRLAALLHGVRLGKQPSVLGRFHLRRFPGSSISIGSQVNVISIAKYYGLNIFNQTMLTTMSPCAQIIIGDNVGFNALAIIARSKVVTIGSNTMIGGNCQIYDSDFHSVWPPEKREDYDYALDQSVTVGENVFIGLNVTILKGVTIGNNSVIAAGSVVVNSIPENSLAAGVPAQVIKKYGLPPKVV